MPFCSSSRPSRPSLSSRPSRRATGCGSTSGPGSKADIRKSEAPIRGDEDGGLDIARRRVGIEGRAGHVDYQVEYEFGVHEWRDVYLDYRQFKPVQVRAGIFKLPFGLEENTSATNLDFIYRARISSRLAPGRDRGVSVHGRVLKNVVSYEAGVFGNDGDNARPSNSARVFGKRTLAARVLTHPFRGSKSPLGQRADRCGDERHGRASSGFRRFARARCSARPSTTRTCGCRDAGSARGWKRDGSRAACRFNPNTSD